LSRSLHQPSEAQDDGLAFEFSRPLAAASIPREGLNRRIEATPAECDALALRFGLIRLDALAAELRVSRSGDGRVRINGALSASVVQTCVVTLEPLPADVDETFAASFAPAALLEDAGLGGREVVVTVTDTPDEDEDDPEPFLEGEQVDLGELVAQHLSLALAPYPRHPEAVLPATASAGPESDTATDRPQTPFADLATRLRRSKH